MERVDSSTSFDETYSQEYVNMGIKIVISSEQILEVLEQKNYGSTRQISKTTPRNYGTKPRWKGCEQRLAD